MKSKTRIIISTLAAAIQILVCLALVTPAFAQGSPTKNLQNLPVAPSAGASLLYVFGSAVPQMQAEVYVDKKLTLKSLAPNSLAALELPPGNHEISVVIFNVFTRAKNRKIAPLALGFEAGKTYYIKPSCNIQCISASLSLLDEEDARKQIAGSKFLGVTKVKSAVQ